MCVLSWEYELDLCLLNRETERESGTQELREGIESLCFLISGVPDSLFSPRLQRLTVNADSTPHSSRVVLDIPQCLNYQLVYRIEKTAPYPVDEREDARFVFCGTWRDGVRHLGAFRGAFGMLGALKTVAKLATPSRMLYFFAGPGGAMLHYGWVRIGRCRQFWINPGEVFIGPIRTVPAGRGKGLATDGIKLGINALIARGFTVFYGNSQKDNLASQRVLEKCGFGLPVSAYLKSPSAE